MRTAWRRELASRAKLSFLPLMLACSLALGWAPSVRAQGTSKTVVMVVDPSALPLALRLRQEIESLGLVVKWLPAERERLPSLEQEAATADAVASIRIAPMGGSDVDMTIFDRVTGKTVSWKLVAASTADPAAGELIATRSVELLRASLVEMAARSANAPAAPPPAKEKPQPTLEPPPVHEAPESLSLLVGPSVLYSTDFSPGLHVLSGLTWMPFSRAGLSAAVLSPLLPARLVHPEGTVELYGSFYRLGAVLEVTGHKSPVSLRLTAAAGVGRLQLRGQPSGSYLGATETRTVASPSLGVTARFALGPHVRFFVDATGSTAFPKTVIRLAGREATDWGRPALSAALGLDFSVPLTEAAP
jgi:hypothetical protein